MTLPTPPPSAEEAKQIWTNEASKKYDLWGMRLNGCSGSEPVAYVNDVLNLAFLAGYERGRRDGLREAARVCATVDSSESSHKTAESNAKAIRTLIDRKDTK